MTLPTRTIIEHYREDQVGMLRDMLAEANRSRAELQTLLTMALDRAEHAEEQLRILREEIAEARATPFG